MGKEELKERFFERFFYAEDSSRDWDRWRRQDPSVVLEFILEELDRAREEGRREVLEDMKKMWDNDNLGDAPKYGSAGAGLMKRWIRDDINERLSKLTTK